MGAVGTKALVAVVSVIAVAATVDAVRNRDRAGQRVRPSPAPVIPAGVVRELREFGARGVLRAEERDGECRVRELSLPDLEPLPGPAGCGAFVARGRLALRNGEAAWFAQGDGHTVVLGRDELARSLGRRDVKLTSVAWLGGRRFAALVADPASGGQVLASFDGDRVAWASAAAGSGYTRVRASPAGTYVAAVRRDGGIDVFARLGNSPPTHFDDATGIAWTADERLTIVSTGHAVRFLATGERDPRAVEVVLPARDVGWRAR